jgi:hypothetical protein
MRRGKAFLVAGSISHMPLTGWVSFAARILRGMPCPYVMLGFSLCVQPNLLGCDAGHLTGTPTPGLSESVPAPAQGAVR